jgi:hypothetical protein
VTAGWPGTGLFWTKTIQPGPYVHTRHRIAFAALVVALLLGLLGSTRAALTGRVTIDSTTRRRRRPPEQCTDREKHDQADYAPVDTTVAISLVRERGGYLWSKACEGCQCIL